MEPVPRLIKLLQTRDAGGCEARGFNLHRKRETLEHLRGNLGEVRIDF